MNLVDGIHALELEISRLRVLEARQHRKNINNESIFNKIRYWIDCDCDMEIRFNHIKSLMETRRIMEARTPREEFSK